MSIADDRSNSRVNTLFYNLHGDPAGHFSFHVIRKAQRSCITSFR